MFGLYRSSVSSPDRLTLGGTREYELAAHAPTKAKANPVIQVENAIGFPMNIDFGLAIGAGTYSTKTRTAKLTPGNYKIYVFSLPDGPGKLVLQISEAAETASK